MKIISYEEYLQRAHEILIRLRETDLLDEGGGYDEEHYELVRRSQVDSGDPTLFLRFKSSHIAEIFIRVFHKHQIIHSFHKTLPCCANLSLDTGTEFTYSPENLDCIFTELKNAIRLNSPSASFFKSRSNTMETVASSDDEEFYLKPAGGAKS